jgi:tetratricopeptide (TPR) repeat protein
MGELEDSGDFRQAIELCQWALALDPDDVAANQQQIHFAMGRMFYRAKNYADARRELGHVLELASLDTMDTDFYRAWAHVYRARIANRLGKTAEVQQEIKAGLASKSPALETQVAWPEAPGRGLSAREALRSLGQTPRGGNSSKRP